MNAAPDPERLAELLCDWSLEVREGDQVLVTMTLQCMELVRAVHGAILERGAFPLMRLSPTEFAEDFYRHAGERQLDSFAPIELDELRAADCLLGVYAPANTSALAGVDPTLIARAARARAPLLQARMAADFRSCGTLWPTPALAQQARMGDTEYAEFVTRTLFLDRADPIAAWRALSGRQAELIGRLSLGHEVRIEAPGTDLRLGIEGRTWINSDGKGNMPSGEVFTGPHERSANGRIRFGIPSNPRGVEIEAVELTFVDGEVVDARAARGDDYLQAVLATDAGARRLGELGIGTNFGIDRPTGSILLDEKMAGTVHLALGRSYPETGGCNVSALHWDLICDLRDGGSITIDGEPLELTAV